MNKTIFYNGNDNIKKAGIPQKYTREEIEEYQKCESDIIYFVKNYVTIVTLDHGKQKFKLRDYQIRMIKSYVENRFNITLTSRQIGKTTTVAAYLLHFVVFNADKSVAILANKEATAREILDRVKLMYEYLPMFLQCGVKEWNKKSIVLGNDSKIRAASTSSDSIRGQTYNCVYLDEFAFVDNGDEFYESTYPVISSGKDSKVIITSTPNGMNLFYKLYKDAIDNKNNFIPIRVDWWEVPHYTEDWKVETIKNIGEKKFEQEYGNRFYGSSGTLIDGPTLERLTWNEPILESDVLHIFEKPQKNHVYVACVDVSEGVGEDFSVITIIDITKTPYEQVLVYRNNMIQPLFFPEIIYNLLKEYNDSFVLVETNSIGSQVADILYNDYEYENMIISKTKNSESVISSGFGGSFQYGLKMTKSSKRIGCSNLKTIIENDILLIQDFNTIQEFQTFVAKKNSYSAEQGKNDDIVMTLVSFAWLTTQQYFIDMIDNNIRETLLNQKNTIIEDDLPAVGFFHDGIDEIEFDNTSYFN